MMIPTQFMMSLYIIPLLSIDRIQLIPPRRKVQTTKYLFSTDFCMK